MKKRLITLILTTPVRYMVRIPQLETCLAGLERPSPAAQSPDAVTIDLGQNQDYPDNLWLRFYNMIRISQESENAKDNDYPTPATFIINPDFLGEVHKICQPQYCPIPYKTIEIPIVSAIQKAFTELQNVQQYIISSQFADPQTDYNTTSKSVLDYINTCPDASADEKACIDGVYNWHKSHWQHLKDANVFAIMWGGGSTTSIVGLSKELDDNGWLYHKTQSVTGQ